jgi:hypothetical protein
MDGDEIRWPEPPLFQELLSAAQSGKSVELPPDEAHEVTLWFVHWIRNFTRKKYWDKPFLCEGDGHFATYRRWMRQFSSEASPEPSGRGGRRVRTGS